MTPPSHALHVDAMAIKAWTLSTLMSLSCASAERPANDARAVSCDAPAARLRPGEVAPDFVAGTSDGRRLDLSSLRSRPVLLHFEASDVAMPIEVADAKLRDAWPEARERGYFVVVVPRARWIDADEAGTSSNVAKLRDADGAVARAYGSTSTDNASRRSFVIGPSGVIERVLCIR